MIRMIIYLAVFGVLTTFTNCSDVGFTKSDDSTVGTVDTPIGNPGDDGNCVGSNCNPKVPTIVDKTLSYTTGSRLNAVDILLVIDNSQSMIQERAELADRLDGFVQDLDAAGIQWQMCYYTTHVASNPDAGLAKVWVGTNSIVLNTAVSGRVQIFSDSINGIPQGGSSDGSGQEMGIAATHEALLKSQNQPCFRSNAGLAVIVISDEDEFSCGGRCGSSQSLQSRNLPDNLIQKVGQLFQDRKPLTFHSIVIKPDDDLCYDLQENQGWDAYYGEVYAEASRKTGGILGNVCATDYSGQLKSMGTRIDETLSSVSLECEPVAGSLKLKISGTPVTTGYRLLGNKILFEPKLGENIQLTGTYQCLVYK